MTTHSLAADSEPKQCSVLSEQELLNILDAGRAGEIGGQFCEATEAIKEQAFKYFNNSICFVINTNYYPESHTDNLFSRYFARVGKIESSDPNKKIKKRVALLDQNKNNIICHKPLCLEPVCKNGLQ